MNPISHKLLYFPLNMEDHSSFSGLKKNTSIQYSPPQTGHLAHPWTKTWKIYNRYQLFYYPKVFYSFSNQEIILHLLLADAFNQTKVVQKLEQNERAEKFPDSNTHVALKI